MGSEGLGLARPDPVLASPGESPPSPDWPLGSVSAIVSALLGRDVPPEEVRDRGVALGLLRYPSPGEPVALSSQTVSRLLLAGYGLPACADRGTMRVLRRHLRDGRRVLVTLADPPPTLVVLEVQPTAPADRADDVLLSVRGGSVLTLPAVEFATAWTAAECRMVAAARAWSELSAAGEWFFGGARDPDGSLYWDVAECSTDVDGRILRC